MKCLTTNLGQELRKKGPMSWTQYSFNYTAVNPSSTLWSRFETDDEDEYTLLDDVSVVDWTTTSIELMKNPSFKSSSSDPIGWLEWCQSECKCSNRADRVTSLGCRSL